MSDAINTAATSPSEQVPQLAWRFYESRRVWWAPFQRTGLKIKVNHLGIFEIFIGTLDEAGQRVHHSPDTLNRAASLCAAAAWIAGDRVDLLARAFSNTSSDLQDWYAAPPPVVDWSTAIDPAVFVAKQNPSPAAGTGEPEPIPTGVYFSVEAANFCDATTRRGMGKAFFEKWSPRRSEFPESVDDAVLGMRKARRTKQDAAAA